MSYPATDCACARESISAQLDGELPERELDRLETHLRLCPACTAWAEEVWDVTRQLREAGLEAPRESFTRPRLRRSWRVSSAVAVASAAAVVATMFFAPGRNSQEGVPQVSGFVGATGQHFVVSRLVRLEDGVYSPASLVSTHADFRHV
ncbi:MAG TPA: zf-HC2 domain-containing protein [Gaiellaceae bacterium]|nr:zf-HC2 domain-containing protein [Gaiellaceae bacterium]